jgi:hypothetical protein
MSKSGKKEHRSEGAAYPNHLCRVAAQWVTMCLMHTDRDAVRPNTRLQRTAAVRPVFCHPRDG